MMGARFAVILVVAGGIVSCGGAQEAPAVRDEGELVEGSPSLGAADSTEGASEEATVPLGVFPSVDALCRAQMEAVGPRLRASEEWLREMGETEPLTPSCKEARAVLAAARVALRPPFLELTAIEVETGAAVETRLVVRTQDGYRALPEAVLSDAHFDPGCPSILRESGLVEVRVEGGVGPVLVVVDGASRAAGEEVDDTQGQDGQLVFWNTDLRRARACQLEGGVMACDAPSVFETRRVPSSNAGGRRERLLGSTTYALDEGGHVVLAAPLDESSDE